MTNFVFKTRQGPTFIAFSTKNISTKSTQILLNLFSRLTYTFFQTPYLSSSETHHPIQKSPIRKKTPPLLPFESLKENSPILRLSKNDRSVFKLK